MAHMLYSNVMVLVFIYSLSASLPKSFPKPDSLNPPNGAATSVLLYLELVDIDRVKLSPTIYLHVDKAGPGIQMFAHIESFVDILGEDSRGQAILSVVCCLLSSQLLQHLQR